MMAAVVILAILWLIAIAAMVHMGGSIVRRSTAVGSRWRGMRMMLLVVSRRRRGIRSVMIGRGEIGAMRGRMRARGEITTRWGPRRSRCRGRLGRSLVLVLPRRSRLSRTGCSSSESTLRRRESESSRDVQRQDIVHPHRARGGEGGGIKAHAVDRDGRAVRADHRSADFALALMSIEVISRRKGSSAEACMRC